jgi:hypothetical protein
MKIDTGESYEKLYTCFNFNLYLTVLMTTSCKVFLDICGMEPMNIYQSENVWYKFVKK